MQASAQENEQPGRVAGIDYGMVHIGVSLSDPGRTIASPFATYRRQGEAEDAEYFRQLVEHKQVTLFVVGLPLHSHGEESELSAQARRFGQWLKKVTGVPVEFYDERYTTQLAEDLLRQAGLRRKRRRQKTDKVAAQLILSSYLERRGRQQ